MSEFIDEFDRIEGHARPRLALTRALARGRLHHAYLFAGPSGVGKRLMAITLAKALNCQGGSESGACGHCRSCRLIAEGQHPDVIVIEPDRSKARWVIKIEQIRALSHQVAFKPYMGRRRVIVIDDAETMMVEGANALLKTLEEPSGETLFVVVTAAPSSLLPTILSRCQLLRFAPLSRQHLHVLLERRGVDSQRAAVIAGYAEGSFARALDLVEDGAIDAHRALVTKIVETRDATAIDVFRIAAEVARTGQANLRVLLDGLLVFYRDVAMVSAGASEDRTINRDLLEAVRVLAGRLTTEEVLRHIDHVVAAQRDLQSYVDAKLVLERLLFDATMSPSPRR